MNPLDSQIALLQQVETMLYASRGTRSLDDVLLFLTNKITALQGLVPQVNQGYLAQIEALQAALPELVLSPSSLPAGAVGAPYNQLFTAVGGTGTYVSLRVTDGQLPPGLGIPAKRLVGTPTQAGQYSFSVTTVDTGGIQATNPYTVTIQ